MPIDYSKWDNLDSSDDDDDDGGGKVKAPPPVLRTDERREAHDGRVVKLASHGILAVELASQVRVRRVRGCTHARRLQLR